MNIRTTAAPSWVGPVVTVALTAVLSSFATWFIITEHRHSEARSHCRQAGGVYVRDAEICLRVAPGALL